MAQAANDPERFHRLYAERQKQIAQVQENKRMHLELVEADPFDVEAQAKIAEMIRLERVQENVQKALEENPESFARVTMLYIDVLVNNVPIKAFVDSGAQTTIMSPEAAERCGIMRLIDTRFGGIAKGVGTAKILGRVHSADIQIGQYNLASSFTVMEGKDVDLLLGLDMLKRHQMAIDLRENCLIVHDEKINFLADHELPRMMDEILESEPKIEGPEGTKIGARTGTVEQFDQSDSASQPTSTSQNQAKPASSATKINIHPAGSQGNIHTNRNAQPGSSSGTAPQQQEQNMGSALGRTQRITPESIAKITDLGFTRQEAIQALEQADGNVELAVGLLL